MGCDRYKEEKARWLYGESGPDAGDLQDHLEECAECREELSDLDEVLQLYREAAPEGMSERLQGRILRRRPVRPRWVSYVAAAAAAAVLVGFYIMIPGGGTEPVEIAWTDIDFEGQRLVLKVTPRERADAIWFRDAPKAWGPDDFAGAELEQIRSRLTGLAKADLW
ncbi:MAG: anti-sigma factor family protein [Planctomycetota bacterium]|jgi:predicted anti-sigma-YlaC factor YlaD